VLATAYLAFYVAQASRRHGVHAALGCSGRSSMCCSCEVLRQQQQATGSSRLDIVCQQG
jgi:hypothetical protein